MTRSIMGAIPLLISFFWADQRKAYLQSVPGPYLPKPGAILPFVLSFGIGGIPALFVFFLGSVNAVVFDSFLLLLFNSLIFLFPAGLISPDEQRFLSTLPLPRNTLRAFEFLHTLLIALSLGIPFAFPVALAAAVITHDMLAFAPVFLLLLLVTCFLTVLIAILFQIRPLQQEKIPPFLINTCLAFNIILFASLYTRSVERTLAEHRSLRSPGALILHILHSLISSATTPLSFPIIPLLLFLLLILAHWFLSGLFSPPQMYRIRVPRATLSLISTVSHFGVQPQTRYTYSILTLYSLRAPRFNLIVIASMAFSLIQLFVGRLITSELDVLFQFAPLVTLIPALIFSASVSDYEAHGLPVAYAMGLDLKRFARTGLLWSSVVTFFIILPILVYTTFHQHILRILPATTVWLALHIYASHLLMHVFQPQMPLSRPSGRLGTSNLFASFALLSGLLTFSGFFLLSQIPVYLGGIWIVLAYLVLLVIALNIVFDRVSNNKLLYVDRFLINR